MSAEKFEPSYKDIEIPKFDVEKIPQSYLQGMSEQERDIIRKISTLEQGIEFLLRTLPVRNHHVFHVDQRIQALERKIWKMASLVKPVVYIGGIVVPFIVTSVTAFIISKLIGE